MAMYNFDTFANHDVTKHREEGEDGGKSCFAVDDEKRYVVDLETVREVAYSSATGVCVRDDYDFVTTIDEFL